jgi:hypothetical protein
MKLTKINYMSAVYFGVMSLITYLAVGVLQWSMRDILASNGVQVTALSTFVTAPIVGGIVGFLMVIVAIAIYNLIAMRFPISWEVKK